MKRTGEGVSTCMENARAEGSEINTAKEMGKQLAKWTDKKCLDMTMLRVRKYNEYNRSNHGYPSISRGWRSVL